MSILRSSSSTSATVISKVAPRQLLPFLYPTELVQHPACASRPLAPSRATSQKIPSLNGLEPWFFSSRSKSSKCHRHKPAITQSYAFFTSHTSEVSAKRRKAYGGSFQRQQHTQRSTQTELEEQELKRDTIREELLALVDQYDGTESWGATPIYEPPRRYQPADRPPLTVSDKAEDEWPPQNHEWPADEETEATLKLLTETLQDFTNDPKYTYQLYRSLPAPRAPYLDSRLRHRLLHHLSVVERKDEQSMLRYLSIVDDMKSTAIPLSLSEWNSAMSFVARYVHRSTEFEVEAALNIWREMEHIAGVKGDAVTFNILFDVATKAGKFTLAEMIYKEMERREIHYDRFHHVSWIFFHGLKADGEAIRAAFRAFERDGEIIDTVVLTALISAFTKCHEATSALAIYKFMKDKAQVNCHPPTHFRARKKLTKIFKTWALSVKNDPSHRDRFQEITPMSPSATTYQILFNYFGVRIGDLQQVATFLDDLMLLKIPLNGSHFFALFRGFSIHGGIRYTLWTGPLLEQTWKNFVKMLDKQPKDGKENDSDLCISMYMATQVLRAFAKCSGKSRVMEIWEEMQQIWDPAETEKDYVLEVISTILKEQDAAEKHNDWVLGPSIAQKEKHSVHNKGDGW